MGEVSKAFIEEFHKLPGNTVGEKRRNLFLLLDNKHSLLVDNKDELEYIAKHLEPTCYLEKIFRLHFLNRFRCLEALLHDYLSGDKITLAKLAKQDWFFQNIFKHIEACDFVNNIIPTMPYVVKLKLLKKLPFEEKLADEIFDALHQRYGIFFATNLLPKCSPSKIEKTLRSHLIKLTPSQLILIYEKDPTLVCVYIEERTKHQGNAIFLDKNPIVVYMAQKNPEIFATLFNKYEFETRLGYKTTRKFILSQKNDVVNKLESYIQVLNGKATVQTIGEELKGIFFKTTSAEYSNTSYWEYLLKYYPKSIQYKIFKSFYNWNFYRPLESCPYAVTEKLLVILKDPLEREKLAIMKIEEGDSRYRSYVIPKYSMKEFKQRLPQMLDWEVREYIKHTTSSCILNKDLDSLLQLCEMVAVRFKNDDECIRKNFVSSFVNRGILDEFGETHWKFIMEILETAKGNEEWLPEGSYLRLKYVEYLIRNGKPIRDVLSEWSDWTDYFVKAQENVKQHILRGLLEIEPKDLGDGKKDFYRSLVLFCTDWNRKHPENTIDVFNHPKVLEMFKSVLKSGDDNDTGTSLLQLMICRTDASGELLEQLKTFYFKNFKRYGETSVCLWFLKHEPLTFQKNLHYFLENATEVRGLDLNKIWYTIKNYSHLGLEKEIVEYLRTKLREKQGLKEGFIKALSLLSPGNSHLEFIKSLGDESEKLHNLIKFLHLTNLPAAVLPTTLEFCKGDYLNSALGPLYSCMYSLPENEIKLIIEKLSKHEEVSLKKHAMHLSCALLDTETAYNYLQDPAMPSLKPASKYLLKNPSDFLWKMVEAKLTDINKQHVHVAKWMMKHAFNLTYKTKYIEALWTAQSEFENEKIKKLLIRRMYVNIIKQLHPDVAYKMVEDFIFKMREGNEFVANLLIHVSDKVKYEFLSKILKSFKENCWKCETQPDAKRTFQNFIHTLTETYFKSENCDQDFAENFSAVFNAVFSSSEAFEEYVMVSLLKLRGKTVENCAKMMIEFNDCLITTYGAGVTDFFINSVKSYILPDLLKSEHAQMEVCYEIFKLKKSVHDFLLVVKLLPICEPQDNEHCKMYKEVFSELERTTNGLIRLEFNLYLKLIIFIGLGDVRIGTVKRRHGDYVDLIPLYEKLESWG